MTAETGRTSSTSPNSTPTATRRATPGAAAAPRSPSSTISSRTSRNRNSVSVRTMPLWNTRLGHSAQMPAATRPTAGPASRRPSTNIRPIVATDSATLSHTATSNAETVPGRTRRASHSVPPSASG